MPRSRFGAPSRQRSTFLDRTEHLALITQHVELLRSDSSHLRVFEINGLGGVGKSRLLNEIREQVTASKQHGYLCWVSLESEGSATEVGPLLALREQLDFDCLMFDTALVAYWHATGQPRQVEKHGRFSDSFVVKALDIGRAAVGVPVSLTFAAEIFRLAANKAARVRRYKKSDFEAIDALRLDPRALRERLPHYLAHDVTRRLELSGKPFVAFFDAYDRQAPSTISEHAPWLREFIGTLDRGVHLITTRDPIGWSMDDWSSVLDRIVLETLPEAEARTMIRERLGVLPTEVEDRILTASRRIPFFLEASIDAYHLRVGDDSSPNVDELPRTPDGAVTHLLDHLPEAHRTLAVALASVQVFDAEAYAYLVRALNLPLSVVDFDQFLEWFFVERLSPTMCKIHDLMTGFVYESAKHAKTRRVALEWSTRYLQSAAHDGANGRAAELLQMFRSVVAGWRAIGEVNRSTVERLVDVGYVLYDLGYWYELAAIAEEVRGHEPAIDIATGFFQALSARRTDGVGRALSMLADLEPRAELLGAHQLSMRLEVAYLSELAGNYAKAREEFRTLDRPQIVLSASNRSQVRARLCHADVLTMDGDLVESSRMLLDAAEQIGTEAPVMWAELVRHRAHNFRFSFAVTEAEGLYLQAIAACADSPSLLAKLHTNLAETLCWDAPQRAIEIAALAYELNARLGNRIELAKCDAARAVAFARIGEYNAALSSAETARTGALNVGYPAGSAFALQARAVAHTLAGDAVAARSSRAALAETVAALGTYDHLRVLPAWLAGDEDEFIATAAPVLWVKPNELEVRLQRWVETGTVRRS